MLRSSFYLDKCVCAYIVRMLRLATNLSNIGRRLIVVIDERTLTG